MPNSEIREWFLLDKELLFILHPSNICGWFRFPTGKRFATSPLKCQGLSMGQFWIFSLRSVPCIFEMVLLLSSRIFGTRFLFFILCYFSLHTHDFPHKMSCSKITNLGSVSFLHSPDPCGVISLLTSTVTFFLCFL